MRAQIRTAAIAVAFTVAVGSLVGVGAAEAGGPVPDGKAVAGVVVDQRFPVPASGRYTVTGHGYGHGRGMSQYGANGAALRGLRHQQILDFYYPGTDLGTARGRLRVLVTADTGRDVVVHARRGLKVRDLGAGRSYTLPRGVDARRWRLKPDARNRDVVSYLAHGRWHPWAPGKARALDGAGEFQATGPLTLVLPGRRTATYRGTLRAARPGPRSKDRDTVNVVGLDAYVRGVVASEMPASWRPEAVQSQAVAARTYAVFNRSHHGGSYYDLCDTTACQVYAGVGGEHPLGDAAVRATARQILRYHGQPAFTEFSSSSGGWTVGSDVPYQVAQRDPYDGWSGNKNHTWSTTVPARAIQRHWPAVGRLQSIRVTARDGHGQWRGRVESLQLVGKRGSVRLSGDDFRFAFGLRSNWFTF